MISTEMIQYCLSNQKFLNGRVWVSNFIPSNGDFYIKHVWL